MRPKRFFAADWHFGSDSETGIIAKMGRLGFSDVHQHDEAVLDAINSTVGERDILNFLGDMGDKPGKYRARIRCKHIRFVIGNHDKYEKCRNVFGEIPAMRMIKMQNGREAVLCHYPLAFWNKSHKGSYHFYGHCHMQRERSLDQAFPNRRSMDVGVDNAIRLLNSPRPFTEDELMFYMERKIGHDPVSFYDNFREGERSMTPDCGKTGCKLPGVFEAVGSLTYHSCYEHLAEIQALCERE